MYRARFNSLTAMSLFTALLDKHGFKIIAMSEADIGLLAMVWSTNHYKTVVTSPKEDDVVITLSFIQELSLLNKEAFLYLLHSVESPSDS